MSWPRLPRHAFTAPVLFLALCFTAAPAQAVTIDAIDVGIGGSHKVGRWTPVVVTLTSSEPTSGKLVLTTPDGDGLSVRYSGAATKLAKGENRLERYVRFGHPGASLTVEFDGDQDQRTTRTFTASDYGTGEASTSELIVTIGGDVGVASALQFRPYRQKRITKVVKLASLNDLPRHPLGWEAIDLIVLATSDINAGAIDDAQQANFRDWLLLGGRAVIVAGKSGAELFGADAPFEDLAPGEFDRVAPLRRTGALETYASSTQRLDNGQRIELDLTLFRSMRGQVELSEEAGSGGAQPLIEHYPVGLGQVSLVAVDLDRPPFDDWAGRAKLLARVLAYHQPGETGKGQDRAQSLPAQLGYSDLSGQLRMALDQFSGVRLVAFSWVAGLIAVYILLIGPGDYFLLRYGLKRMQITWVTLALLSVGGVALAWSLNDWFKGEEPRINEANIVDVDTSTGVARGTTWTHIYAPQTSPYDLSPRVTVPLPPADAPALKSSPTALKSSATALAWQGLPGTGLGGLDGRAAPNLFDLPYDLEYATSDPESARIDSIPIQAAATKGFVTSWWQAVTPDPNVKLTLAGNRTLVGKFVYNLEWELDDCAIAHENWLYRINGTVKKGQTIELTPATSSRNLPYELTRKRKIDDKDIVTPWNPRSDETPRILQIMMFHKAAGGDNYTGLTQRYEPRLDLSNHLTTGRAILIGRTADRPLTWDGDDRLNEAYDQSVTIVRMVIPVEATSSSE